jgi:hypothetical protein
VRQVQGGTGRPEDDRFRIVTERDLHELSTAYEFIETADLTEAEVEHSLAQAGYSPPEVARALRTARAAFTRPLAVLAPLLTNILTLHDWLHFLT